MEARKTLAAYSDDYEWTKWLYDQHKFTLSQMVDESEFASNVRYELQALANEYGLVLLWTPPHVGKYLNPIELVWLLVKARVRRLRPEYRKKDAILKRELGGS